MATHPPRQQIPKPNRPVIRWFSILCILLRDAIMTNYVRLMYNSQPCSPKHP